MALYRNEGQRADLADVRSAAGGARVPRPLWQIYQDVAALSAAQKTNVWNDLNSGTPKKYLKAVGPNAAAVNALDWAITMTAPTGAALQSAQQRIMAMACQDYPDYLVHPAFDPSINVSGDEPAVDGSGSFVLARTL